MKYITQILVFIMLIISITNKAQTTISPLVGGRYTGGLSYSLADEFYSGEIGVLLDTENSKKLLPDGYMINYQLMYDSDKVFTGLDENFYAIRLQAYKMTIKPFAFTAGISYMDSYDNSFKRQKFGFTTGILMVDKAVVAGLVMDNLATYTHVSIHVNIRLFNKKL